jgi:hypothetical protein
MAKKWLAIYSAFFLGVLVLALFLTGVFQQGILPRLRGAGSKGGIETKPAEGRSGPAQLAKETPGTDAQPVGAAGGAEASHPDPSPTPQAPPSPPAPPKQGAIETAPQLKRLARVYEGMRPKEAASVLEKLDRALAARVLSEIRERQTAKILGVMSPQAAAELTRMLGQGKEEEPR